MTLHLHGIKVGPWPEEREDEVDDSLPVVAGKGVPEEKNKNEPELEQIPGYENTDLALKTVPADDEDAHEVHSPSGGEEHEDMIDMTLPGIIDEEIPHDKGHHHNLPTMEEIMGYEHAKFESGVCHPPKHVVFEDERPKHTFKSIPVISEEIARDALLQTVSGKVCWGTNAAKELSIIKLHSETSYAYHLETYTEGRAIEWKWFPYTPDVNIDGKSSGPPPSPWEVPVEPTHIFHDEEVKHLEVPHSACVKGCHRCNQTGFLRCASCHGRGKKKCSKCHGKGMIKINYDDVWKIIKCRRCDGEKHRKCLVCKGSGHHKCETCAGHAKLKWYIRMTVTWKNHISEHLIERTPLPDELVYEVPGNICFYERHQKVLPVTDFTDTEINQISQKYVEEHHFPNHHILMQRHRIRAVPVTEVKCRWNDKNFEFIVYGLDNHVYCPEYPQRCCCGCCVL